MTPVVGHVVNRWLPLTETFTYGYVTNSNRTSPLVFARERENDAVFPFPRVSVYGPSSPISRTYLGGLRAISPALAAAAMQARVARTVVQRHVDILHGHFGPLGLFALPVATLLRRPLVVSFYGYDMSSEPRKPGVRAKYLKLFAAASKVIAIGRAMKSRIVDLGCSPEKISIVHIGADLTTFAFRERRRAQNEGTRFIFCGRFVEKKGLDILLRSFAEVRQQVSDARLTVIGDGPERDKIDRLLSQLNLGDSVSMLGLVDHERYRLELERHHILVGPSVTAQDGDDEGGVLTCALEAASAGLPVIATRHADIPEHVIDGQTGVLVPERDVSSLTKAMVDLARHPERWPTMGLAGRRLVEAEFNIVTETVRLEDLYLEILAARS